THGQRPHARIERRADAEDEQDAEADVNAGHHRADPEPERIVAQEADLLLADERELVDRVLEHGTVALPGEARARLLVQVRSNRCARRFECLSLWSYWRFDFGCASRLGAGLRRCAER